MVWLVSFGVTSSVHSPGFPGTSLESKFWLFDLTVRSFTGNSFAALSDTVFVFGASPLVQYTKVGLISIGGVMFAFKVRIVVACVGFGSSVCTVTVFTC